MTDQTAKRATGFEGATLENTLTAEQMQRLAQIRNALDGSYHAANVGKTAGMHNVEAIASGKNLLGVTTGFKDLDDKTGGYMPSDLLIVAARPGLLDA